MAVALAMFTFRPVAASSSNVTRFVPVAVLVMSPNKLVTVILLSPLVVNKVPSAKSSASMLIVSDAALPFTEVVAEPVVTLMALSVASPVLAMLTVPVEPAAPTSATTLLSVLAPAPAKLIRSSLSKLPLLTVMVVELSMVVSTTPAPGASLRRVTMLVPVPVLFRSAVRLVMVRLPLPKVVRVVLSAIWSALTDAVLPDTLLVT